MKERNIHKAVDKIGFVPILLGCIFIGMSVIEPRFFSRLNLLDMTRNFAFVSIVATGQALVMIVGGFDLSVAIVIALSSIVAASTMGFLSAAWMIDPLSVSLFGCAMSLGIGGFIGFVNAFLVIHLKAAAFMITLGVSTAAAGVIFFFTNGAPIYGMPEVFTVGFARSQILMLPVMFWIAFLIVGLTWFVMSLTPTGRHVYATGANASAARIAGINERSIIYGVYIASGVFAAIVGLLLTARIGSGQSDLSASAAMQSIAAAVVGGVSLKGGVGNVGRVALGALLIVVLSNALNLSRIDSRFSMLFLGVVLLIAALIEVRLRRENFDE